MIPSIFYRCHMSVSSPSNREVDKRRGCWEGSIRTARRGVGHNRALEGQRGSGTQVDRGLFRVFASTQQRRPSVWQHGETS
eukprot:8369060-Pyramimonas_sp.AAC.1